MACRICASTVSINCLNIFVGTEPVSDMITTLSGLKPTPDDGLPDIACSNCYAELKSALSLRRKCLESDAQLRLCLSAKIESPTEDVSILESIEDVEETPTITYKIIYENDMDTSHIELELDDEQHVVEEEVLEEVLEQPEEEPKTCEESLELMFRCCGCEIGFETKELLLKHSKAEHESNRTCNEERPFECGICFRRYMSERGLKVHRRGAYQLKRHQCSICGKRFLDKTTMNNHERSHTKAKPFACESCPKSFGSRSNLLSHEKLHRPELSRHVCTLCGNRFSRKSYLKQHYTLLHSDETPFQCSLCAAKFKAKANLRLHMRTHTQERPYSCELCDKSFMYPTDKKRHMIQHTGQKPFQCTHCEKAFTRKGLLRKHQLCHEEEEEEGEGEGVEERDENCV
uniref:Zinc finger protein 782 n=1 Tax=Culex pipiens TaxID=7175 RepID=A0A8D8A776_CULPI